LKRSRVIGIGGIGGARAGYSLESQKIAQKWRISASCFGDAESAIQPDDGPAFVHVAPPVSIKDSCELVLEVARVVELGGDGERASKIDESPAAADLRCRQIVVEASRHIVELRLDDECTAAIDEAPLPTDPDGRPIARVAPPHFLEARLNSEGAGLVDETPQARGLHRRKPPTKSVRVVELRPDHERPRGINE